MTAGFVLKFISPDNTLNRMEIRVFAEKFAHFCPAGSLEVQTKEVEKVEKDLLLPSCWSLQAGPLELIPW